MTTMTKSEFARHISVKPSYVTDLGKQGRLVMEGNRVLVAESIQRIADTKDPAKIAVAMRHAAARGAELPEPAPAPENAPEAAKNTTEARDFQDSRAKREHFAAEREEMAYLKDAGDLLEKTAVVSVVTDAATILRGKLESLPDLLAPQLVGIHDEQRIRATLVDYMEEALEGVARQFAGLVDVVK